MANENGGQMTEPRPDTRLELHIQQNPDGEVSATVPVRWCVTQELIDQIKSRGFKRPQLVLAVRALREETFLDTIKVTPTTTSVYVVPLTQELQFVSFRRSGKNEVRVIIVDADSDDVIERLRKLRRGSWKNVDVFDDEGEPSYSGIKEPFKYIVIGSHLDVDVPEEMFAKPYPEWQRKLVRRFFPKQDVDQCHFRKRRILSALGAVSLLTIGQVFKLFVTLIAAIIGARDIEWKHLLHPWKSYVFDPVDNCDKSVWFWDKNDNKRITPLAVINPIFLIATPVLVYGIMQGKAHSWNGKAGHGYAEAYKLSFPGWWSTVWMVDLSIVLLVLALTALFFISVVGIGGGISKYTGSESRRQRIRRERTAQEKSQKQKVLAALEAMTCSGGSALASYEALPKDKRTAYLWFNDKKMKVCKPFQL